MSDAYDVSVSSPNKQSGDVIRVKADSPEAAGTAALEHAPEGWAVDGIFVVADLASPAFGVDKT